MKFRVFALLMICLGIVVPAVSMEVGDTNLSVDWGFSSRQGLRSTMEDAHTVRALALEPFAVKPSYYFGVFDGHGGAQAANYAAKYGPTFFFLSYKDAIAQEKATADQAVKDAFMNSYDQLDKGIQQQYQGDGTTAVSAVISGDTLYTAWAGDARALVLGKNGAIKFATEDHKPGNQKERERIESVGAPLRWYDVKGGKRIARIGKSLYQSIAIPRALGDKYFKQLYPGAIIATPDIDSIRLESGDTIILACDGVWDVMSNSEVGEFVSAHLSYTVEQLQAAFSSAEPPPLKPHHVEVVEEDCRKVRFEKAPESCNDDKLTLIARGLRDRAVRAQSRDNISVMVIQTA